MIDDMVRRNTEIAAALRAPDPVSAKQLAHQYGLSVSHIYRIGKKNGAERFADSGNQMPSRSMVGGGLFKELGLTGLRRFAGSGEIDEEYDRVWKPLNKKCALIREMSDDAICAAVEMAVRMTLRRVGWYVEAGGDEDVDKESAEWLETCKDDMSQSWNDTIDSALGMIKWGFQLAEIVYKKRGGLRDGQAIPSSKYDDGRIGWRKWVFISPDSLAPGSPWQFDEHGGLQSLTQQAPPDYQAVVIPIDKSLLFRMTTDKGNPEGKSLFRPMYGAWYMKKNLEEIEAISAERIGAGFPIAYLGSDVQKNLDDPESDASQIQNALRSIRVDDQMSLLIPFAKMGSGAAEGNGVLFEFASPPGTKAINFHETITRYEQRMAMVGLAQFIHLGMNQVGARALGESSTDFFTMAVVGWVDSIEETIHRYGTERLFRLNKWAGLTGYPRIKHESVSRQSLGEIADYISKLAGVGIIVPELELEKHVRQLADLPERPIQVVPAKPTTQTAKETEPETGDEDKAAEVASERFADLRGAGRPGARSKPVIAVNAYQKELERIYNQWSDDLAEQLAEADPDERDGLLEVALAALLVSLRDAGRRSITESAILAWDDTPPTPEMLDELSDAIEANDRYLRDSLIPALRVKVEAGLDDEDIILAIDAGTGNEALAALLLTMVARVASYSGAWWAVYNRIFGDAAREKVEKVFAHLDPTAKHCSECPEFQSEGGREYASYDDYLSVTGGRVPGEFECGAWCRCWLTSE